MPTMRMPWSKLGNLQLDLLDAPTVPEAAPSPPAAPGAAARSASMVPTASLYEDANNPRTEIPGAELDELAEDIRQHGILQPIIVHPANAAGRHQIHFGAKRWRAAQRIGLLEVPVVVRDGPTNPYAQAQCRATIETLHELKHPRPVAFVQKANIADGPQQLNNGAPPARAGKRKPRRTHNQGRAMNCLRTPEHRRQQAERIRAWEPWKRSTGPRSPEGKAAASRNAFRGGHRQMLRELARTLTWQREALEDR